jgi:hypothetical protein
VIGGDPTSFAFDAKSQQLLAMDATGKIWGRRAGVWEAAPFALTRAGYQLIADERRGHAVILPLNGVDTRVYEYDAGTWRELAPLPTPVVGNATYDPTDGRIVIVGGSAPGRADSLGYTFSLVRTLASGAAVETCAGGMDGDGDGAAACADVDCYGQCERCPPFTSCP